MTAVMELLHPAPFLLFLLFLLTRPGVTSADNNGAVKVTEGDDVVLPCSHGQTDLTYKVFDWTKVEDDEDKTQNVFLYDSGIHYNNGLAGQDPQFKGRVSHFEDELQRGNASIKIRNTKVEDSGNYKCIFPHLGNQIFHIELVVGPVKVTEGDDVVLPCSLGQIDLNYQLFDWTKVEDDEDKTQKEVFLYDGGIHYNNGRTGQDPQFKGRVSHFEDELQHGNASIKIRNTKLEDRGKYKCFFPLLQNQIFHIELVVDPVLRKRNVPGAAPEPSLTGVHETAERALLQCSVKGAFPKPTVEWKNSAGEVLHSVVTLNSEVKKLFDITLQTNVTQTGHYSCVVTQYDISHQVSSETFVLFAPEPPSGSESSWWDWFIPGLVGVVIGVVIGGVFGGVFEERIGVAARQILAFLRTLLEHCPDFSAHSNADSKVDDEDAPLPTNGSSDNRVVEKEGSDAVHVL